MGVPQVPKQKASGRDLMGCQHVGAVNLETLPAPTVGPQVSGELDGHRGGVQRAAAVEALLNRMKVAMGLAANRLPGVRVEPPAEALRVESTRQLVTQLGQQLLGQELSESTRAALEAELAKATPALEAGGRQAQARLALGWLLASPEFQRR